MAATTPEYIRRTVKSGKVIGIMTSEGVTINPVCDVVEK
jgi:hypothetical protein